MKVDVVNMQALMGAEGKQGEIPEEMASQVDDARIALIEAAAESDDELIMKYLEGEDLTAQEIQKGLHAAVLEGTAVPVLVTAATAFVAGLLASSAVVFGWGAQPQLALASAVLLLVPGVPLINAAQDLIKGYAVIGLARGTIGLLISLSIALGLLLAMQLMGVSGL